LGSEIVFKGEIITSAVVFLGSLYLYLEAMKFEGHDVYGKLGPAYWPKFLLICLMALSVLVAWDAFRERKKGDSEKKEPSKGESGKVRFFSAIGLIVLYFILLQIFGFILLTPFFLMAFMTLLGERKKSWILGISLGITILIVWVFTKAMYVPLPRGQWIFLDFSHLFY
jgi:putative tricarboxylic transport membrane protein